MWAFTFTFNRYYIFDLVNRLILFYLSCRRDTVMLSDMGPAPALREASRAGEKCVNIRYDARSNR